MNVEQKVAYVATIVINVVFAAFSPLACWVDVVEVDFEACAVVARREHFRNSECRHGVDGNISGVGCDFLAVAVASVEIVVGDELRRRCRSAIGIQDGIKLAVLVKVDIKICLHGFAAIGDSCFHLIARQHRNFLFRHVAVNEIVTRRAQSQSARASFCGDEFQRRQSAVCACHSGRCFVKMRAVIIVRYERRRS